jgi:hypothetical protein
MMPSEADTCADAHPSHRTSGIFCHKEHGELELDLKTDITLDITINLGRPNRFLLEGQVMKWRPTGLFHEVR